MTIADLAKHRLINHGIAGSEFEKPQEVVQWLGAMQAQEFAMAKWAIALRARGVDDVVIENAFNRGDILRTHLLRPTWHFVSPDDIRWLLMLTAPRVHAVNAYWYRKFELDAGTLKRSRAVFEKALAGKHFLTRDILNEKLAEKKIHADGLRLAYLFMHAELEGLICSGPRQGKQFTYAWLDERVPETKTIAREEALARLANRYFTSRSPATVHDLSYWSGLTLKDAQAAANLLPATFENENVNGVEYIEKPGSSKISATSQTTFLMPDYDEYGMSYKNREALVDPKRQHKPAVDTPGSNHMLVVNGVISGTWQRKQKSPGGIEVMPFYTFSKQQTQAVAKAVKEYLAFAMPNDKAEAPRKKVRAK
ncbi:winged helix DNA-binding domain-containing protein [Chryseolinea lacunae]|uniref:AlkZ family DNA glycosylase n=1 Tax=Chryseolinea lacunae TaxID=2801331 RepID=A0ABS1KUV4_9BACT|nr:winged helix DNA-binding domain-containing protein [Chryseolinea lacunae]MBL0743120.1 AlkZ family DNA glycosylase [Chryseolinea lacunae]